MILTNRKTLRAAIKASMDVALVGVGKPAQICYQYQTGAFDEEVNGDPANVAVIVITGNGSDRWEEGSLYVQAEQVVFINVHTFVLYEKEGEWTESQSEDAIDDLEAGIITWVSDNSDLREAANSVWLEVSLMGKSNVDSAFIGGIEYRHEVLQMAFLVANTS
jgi:hypothetical protein